MREDLLGKSLAFSLILCIVGASVIPSTGAFKVEKSSIQLLDSTILYVGGDGPGNYSSIQDAIDAAHSGDTVYVFDNSSPYYENVVVDKSIHLVGENRDTTVIDGGSETVIQVVADWVHISGFTLEGDYSNHAGVDIYYFSNNTISDNIITNNWNGVHLLFSNYNIITGNYVSGNFGGIWLGDSNNNLIVDNIVNNADVGVSLNVCNHNKIINNTISNSSHDGIDTNDGLNNTFLGNIVKLNSIHGINIVNSSGATIEDNTINLNHNYGINLYNSSNNTLIANTISMNFAGIWLGYSSDHNSISYCGIFNNTDVGISIDGSSDSNSILYCNIMTNSGSGIHLRYSSDNNLISNCEIDNNIVGIHLLNSDECLVTRNNISNNDIGISLDGSSRNSILHNNFIDNKANALCDDIENQWDNGTEGNYWSDYTGRDLNRDGIGDTPYIISENNQDNYPWMRINGKSKSKPTINLLVLDRLSENFPLLARLLHHES